MAAHYAKVDIFDISFLYAAEFSAVFSFRFSASSLESETFAKICEIAEKINERECSWTFMKVVQFCILCVVFARRFRTKTYVNRVLRPGRYNSNLYLVFDYLFNSLSFIPLSIYEFVLYRNKAVTGKLWLKKLEVEAFSNRHTSRKATARNQG